jgi:hypothetical protein
MYGSSAMVGGMDGEVEMWAGLGTPAMDRTVALTAMLAGWWIGDFSVSVGGEVE